MVFFIAFFGALAPKNCILIACRSPTERSVLQSAANLEIIMIASGNHTDANGGSREPVRCRWQIKHRRSVCRGRKIQGSA